MMKTIHTVEELEALERQAPSSLALGAFDGLHRGHMAVIHAACAPGKGGEVLSLSLIHNSEPTRTRLISFSVLCV